MCRAAIALALTARSLLRDENVLIHWLCQEIHAIISKKDCRIMAGYFRLIPALRHPSFTQRKNSVFLCTRICGAGTKFALEAICLMKVRYFLVTIAVCLMLSVCSGCYGTGYDRSIPAMAYPSGNVLEISTGAELNPGTYILWRESVFNRSVIICAGTENILRRRCISDRLHSFTGEYRCSDLGSARQRHARCILSGKSRPGRRKELVSLFRPML
mgnify:CR=1 FL=1